MSDGQPASLDLRQNSLLLSKLRPPRLAADLIERPGLLALLDRTLICPLTVLSAPAGFGKTTLLQQWLEKRQADFPSLAWVSLDTGDNDPLRFWSYLAAAGQTFQPPLPPLQIIQQIAPFGPSALHHYVTTFVNEVTRLDCRGLLVLENYHLIHEPQVHETLLFLIEHLPPDLHLILLTRTDPPFALARLRANHQLVEIHTSHLAFSREEMLDFLQQTLPFDLPEQLVAQIEKQIEGWVAGLRLLTLAFQKRTTPDEIQQLLSSFTGRHRYLFDYFLTEVLSAQTEAVQMFLFQTCHLQRLCAPLCDQVINGNGSELLLAEIERAGLFLQEIEGSAGWYHYHALFAEAMQHAAQLHLGEAQIALCLERAQDWYEQHGLLDEAIEIALRRLAYSDAIRLLERLVEHRYIRSERVYSLVRWLELLPEAQLASSPLLCFVYASVLTFGSSSDWLNTATFERVMELLQYAEEQWQDQHSSLAEVYALRAMISGRHEKIPQAARAARQALALLPPQQSIWRTICRSILALEARWQGHFQAFYQMMQPGFSFFKELQEPQGVIILQLYLGEFCLEQGRLYQAEELFQAALREAQEKSNDQTRALIGMAQLAYERNQLDQAQQNAQRALTISTTINDPLLQLRATLALARITAASGAMQNAMKMLHALLVLVDQAQLSWQPREIMLWQMRLTLVSGDTAPVQRWLNTTGDQEVPRLQQEQEALLRARWLLYTQRAQEVLTLLQPWLEEALANERLRSTLEIKLLLSMAYQQLKQPQEVRKLLGEVLQFAHTENYVRLFLDEGQTIAPLLSAQLTITREKTLQDFIRAILHVFDTPQKPQHIQSGLDNLGTTLSPQERQILRLLAQGMDRQEIANQLVISLNTVKTHLQRLYQKLHVTKRFEAVEIARQLDLTD